MPSNLSTALEASKLYASFTKKQLLAMIVAKLWETPPAPQVTAYPGPPTHVPGSGAGIHIDTLTGDQTPYYNGAWRP